MIRGKQTAIMTHKDSIFTTPLAVFCSWKAQPTVPKASATAAAWDILYSILRILRESTTNIQTVSREGDKKPAFQRMWEQPKGKKVTVSAKETYVVVSWMPSISGSILDAIILYVS